MSTKQSTIEYIVDQLSRLDSIRYRKMFGEYALYYRDTVVAFVCDDHLFVKVTSEGEEFASGRYVLDHAYPGSKLYMKIDPEFLEDSEWLFELMVITERLIPKKVKK